MPGRCRRVHLGTKKIVTAISSLVVVPPVPRLSFVQCRCLIALLDRPSASVLGVTLMQRRLQQQYAPSGRSYKTTTTRWIFRLCSGTDNDIHLVSEVVVASQ